jgi:hypothetical protein
MYAVTLRFALVTGLESSNRGGRGVTQLYRAAEVHDCIGCNGLTGPHANSIAARRVAARRIDQMRPGFIEVFIEIESLSDPARFPRAALLPQLASDIAERRVRRGENRNAVENVTVHAVGPFVHEWSRCSAAVYDILRGGEHTYPTEAILYL